MSKEAMKLALEALELYQSKSSVQMFDDAIKALREALAEQPAQQEPVSFLDWYDNAHWGNEDFKAGCWRAWDAALAQRKPLTDEQWQEIAAITGCLRIEKRGRNAILRVFEEAAHGIKENA